MLNINEENRYSIFWWISLSFVSILNILIYIKILFKNNDIRISKNYFLKMNIYAGFYVLVCAFRSIFPRIDVERICFWDSYLSLIVLGRSAATIAELCFIAQICLFFRELSKNMYYNHKTYKNNLFLFHSYLILGLISIAEIFSWLGVITKHQIFNSLEEFIWMISFFIFAICFIIIYNDTCKLSSGSNNLSLQNFLLLFSFISIIFVIYMFTVDIPMYYRRWTEAIQRGDTFLSISDGFNDIFHCKIISNSFIYWKEDIIWMTPYFTGGVWLSLYLMTINPEIKNKENFELKTK
jgi:hypothetical protein